MKIEGNNPGPESAAAKKLERAQNEASRPGTPGTPATAGDRVELSPDAALAHEAVKAAASAPEIRQDLVDRMRKALAAGELGNDPKALADRIIGSLIDEK
jgi:negative regulator of flagellin synthesis FlgM